jgi:hypothetical protein
VAPGDSHIILGDDADLVLMALVGGQALGMAASGRGVASCWAWVAFLADSEHAANTRAVRTAQTPACTCPAQPPLCICGVQVGSTDRLYVVNAALNDGDLEPTMAAFSVDVFHQEVVEGFVNKQSHFPRVGGSRLRGPLHAARTLSALLPSTLESGAAA